LRLIAAYLTSGAPVTSRGSDLLSDIYTLQSGELHNTAGFTSDLSRAVCKLSHIVTKKKTANLSKIQQARGGTFKIAERRNGNGEKEKHEKTK
jgi:hypothetical protein